MGFSRWKMGFRRDFGGFDLLTMQRGNARSRTTWMRVVPTLELLFTFQYSTT